MIKRFAITPLAAALLLSGCVSMAPNYERPAAPVAASFPVSTAAGEAASAIEWQRYFGDARLQELVRLALANNRDLRIAVLNIEQARAQFRITRADRLPTLGLQATGNRVSNDNEDVSSLYSVGLGVSAFELDLFGRVKSLSDAALAQYLATEEARRAVQVSLVSSVANAYLATLADDELLALTERTLATRDESFKLVQLRFDNGVVSRVDLEQARSLVETARATLAQLQRQRAADFNLLTLLVGQTVPATLPAAATLQDTLLADLPAGLPSDLLASRPDIRAAEQQLIAANANIGAARANFFPRISLTAAAGSTSTELSGLFSSGTFGWTFAPQMVLPLFDTGRNLAILGSANAGRDIAVAQYEKSIQTAFREVSDALAGQATYAEQVRAQRAVAEAEAERFRLAELRYQNGAASYLDYLDAQRSLFAAQQAAVQANLQRLQNQVTLYRVLGGGDLTAAR